jgi:hypothetical protein
MQVFKNVKIKETAECNCFNIIKERYGYSINDRSIFKMSDNLNCDVVTIPCHEYSAKEPNNVKLIPSYCPFCGKELFPGVEVNCDPV